MFVWDFTLKEKLAHLEWLLKDRINKNVVLISVISPKPALDVNTQLVPNSPAMYPNMLAENDPRPKAQRKYNPKMRPLWSPGE